jgi:hypothetical protein
VPQLLPVGAVGLAAYKRLRTMRDEFRDRVRFVRGSIASLPFHVDVVVLPSNEVPLDVGFGAGHAVFKAANGAAGRGGPLDTYIQVGEEAVLCLRPL